jgi:hypothetical protein
VGLRSAHRRGIAVAATCVALLLAVPGSASASRYLKVGLIDDEQTLRSATPDIALEKLQELNAQVLKVSLYWNRVAPTRPNDPTDPADPAYDWTEVDRMAIGAQERGMRSFSPCSRPRPGRTQPRGGIPPIAWATCGRSPPRPPAGIPGVTRTLPTGCCRASLVGPCGTSRICGRSSCRSGSS